VPFLKIDIYLQNSSPYEFCKYRCRMHDTQLYVHNNQFITAFMIVSEQNSATAALVVQILISRKIYNKMTNINLI